MFVEKGKKSLFKTFFPENHHFVRFSKTPPFPDHVSSWSIYLQQLMPAHWHSCIKHTPFHFLFEISNRFQNLHIFAKLCTWSSRASQLSISEDSAIRIVLPFAKRFSKSVILLTNSGDQSR